MALPSVARQKIIALLDELPGDRLPDITTFLEFLRFKAGNGEKRSRPLSEAELLKIINRRLPSKEQRRFSQLQAKIEVRRLTQVEHQEFMELVERTEQANVERAEALVELARLRNA